MLKLHGMDGAAMDYAIHGHAVAHVPLGDSVIECMVSHREEDSLLLHLPKRCPIIPRELKPLYVHFEINHGYFEGLHKAINGMSTDAISKLLPNKSILPTCKTGRQLNKREGDAIRAFTLDNEYQMIALKKMISSHPDVPFIVLGPFGTGKTHMLAAAVTVLLCNPHNQILVCTHQHQCANNIYRFLLKHCNVMRLVPNEATASHIKEGKNGVFLVYDVTNSIINRTKVIVTTFLTATNLRKMEESDPDQPFNFSHILIDEGAQTREPEALGALAVVKSQTKVVIVGDNKQVGCYVYQLFR